MIPYGRQLINDSDISAVTEVLKSGWLTTGPNIAKFETAFAKYIGAKHAIVVSNATAALHIAMLTVGIGRNDRVVTSPNTFLASANAAAFVGATPDFVDIDPVSRNLCPDKLEEGWTSSTKAVVAVDYAGQSCEMKRIHEITQRNQAFLIEDACHAIGGRFYEEGKEWKVGAHPWADMTTFSFHPVKTMTTGEGGMIVTDNDELASKARLIRNHGMTRDENLFVGLSDDVSSDDALREQGPWYYEMQELGYNYRITDFQCALGLTQLSRLDSFIERRREIVDTYNKAFSEFEHLTTPRLKSAMDRDVTSWHLYTVEIAFDNLGKSRTAVMQELRNLGVGTQVLYIPIYLQPWYRKTFGYKAGKCPQSEVFYKRALSLPLFPAMTDSDVAQVIAGVETVVKKGLT